jgi:phage-related protein
VTVIGEAFIDVKSKTDTFDDDTTSRVGNIAKKAALIFAGAFALDKVKDFVKGSIDAASDLNESISKSGVVFGDQQAKVLKWASTSATAMGMSKQAAIEAAGTYGNLFVALGITGAKAEGMSTKLVGLAGDLASFNNVSPQEALDALRSGLTGETEPLKRFGVNMNDATLHAQALKMGLISNIKDALDPSVKAQAAYALILDQTKTAQGDFGRTSDGLANKQRIVAAQFEDVKAKIGTVLLPAMLAVEGFISSSLGPAFDWLSGVVRDFISGFTKGTDALGSAQTVFARIGAVAFEVYDSLRQLFGVLTQGDFKGGFLSEDSPWVDRAFKIRDAIAALIGFVKDNAGPVLAGLAGAVAVFVVPAFVSWAVAAGAAAIATIAAAAPVIALVAGIGLLVGGLVYAYNHFEAFRTVVQTVAKYVRNEIGDLVDWWEKIWPQVSEAVQHVMHAIEVVVRVVLEVLKRIWHAVGDDVLSLVERVFHAIAGVISGVMAVIRGVIQTVLALINGDWGKAWDGIKEVLGGVWDVITSLLTGALGVIQSLLGAALSLLGDLWHRAWDGITDVLSIVWDKITGIFETGIGWVQDHWQLLLGILLTILTGGMALVIGAIVTHWDDIVGFFRDGIARVISFVEALPGRLLQLAIDAIASMLVGLITAVVLVWKFWTDFVPSVIRFIGDLGGTLLSKGWDLLMGLLHGIENAAPMIWNFYTSLPGRIIELIANAGDWLWQKGVELLHGMVRGVEAGLGALWDFLRDLPARILRGLENIGDWLWEKGVTLLRGMIRGIDNAAHEIGDWIGGLPGKVKGWIGDAASWLLDAGRDLIRGLIHGIENTAHELIDAIKRSVTDKLPGFVKDALGVKSPSTVFAAIGRNVVEGMALGLRDTKPIDDAARRLIPQLRGGLGGLSAAGIGLSSTANVIGPGAVVVHLSVAGGADRDSAVYAAAVARREVQAGLEAVLDRFDALRPAG